MTSRVFLQQSRLTGDSLLLLLPLRGDPSIDDCILLHCLLLLSKAPGRRAPASCKPAPAFPTRGGPRQVATGTGVCAGARVQPWLPGFFFCRKSSSARATRSLICWP